MKGKRWFVLVIAGIIAFYFISQQFGFMRIKKVEVKQGGAECVSGKELTEDLNISGRNIFEFSVDEKKTLDKYPCIKSIEIKKKLPNRIVMVINGRKPFMRVARYGLAVDFKESTPSSQTALIDWSEPVSSTASYFLADDEGVVFATTGSTSLAIFFFPEEMRFGKKVTGELFQKIVEVLRGLNNIGERVSFGKITGNSLLIQGDIRAAFGLSSRIDRQVASLQLILGKAKIDGRLIESLDLRFDKPVVIYKGKSL